MTNDAQWRVLAQNDDKLPRLLLQSHISDYGYTISLTDLNHVFSEQLSKEDIIERAHNLECDIDPGEDDQQYDIFVSKLRDALHRRPGTSIKLNSTRASGNITVSLAAELPKPLRPLEWELILQKKDDGTLQRQLTQPLIDRAHVLEQQIKHLIDELQAKDHVLSRMSDRLEASGTPLTEVFPNVANIGGGRTRPVPRGKLAQHVRGLATFDERSWRRQLDHPTDVLDNDTVLNDVLAGLASSDKTIRANWWRGLDIELKSMSQDSQDTSQSSNKQHRASDNAKHKLEQQNRAQADSEPEQRQPQHDALIKNSTFEPHRNPATNDDPTDEEEAGPTPHTSQSTPAVEQEQGRTEPIKDGGASALPARKKLGAIGGKRRAPEPEPDNQVQSSLKQDAIGANTVSDNSPITTPGIVTEPPTKQPLARKLGTIGGKSSKPAPEKQPDQDDNAQQHTKEQVTPAPEVKQDVELDEEQRADLKRNELKRELEQKAKAPTKKKRRF